jgi:phenylacetate-CoA ligase
VLVESHETLVEADKAAVTERLVARIKDRIGTTARVEVRDPGGIERSVGKARRVVDERPTSPHTSR